MELLNPNNVEILDENIEVIENAVEILNQHDIDINGNYSMPVAIVGATGSGKSFLWDKLFNCKFDVKKPEQSSRVTVGGWMHYSKANNTNFYTLLLF